MTQTPPPSEAKSIQPYQVVAIITLFVGLVIGGLFGWWIEHERWRYQSEYTNRLTVLRGTSARVDLLNYTYIFWYKQTISGYDPEKPIEVYVRGLTYPLPSTIGKSYNVAGIEVLVSESYDDYVILLVKPL